MPIYEYDCQNCNEEFELLVRGNEKPVCPKCGKSKVEKLLSVTAKPSGASEVPVLGGDCGRPQCASGGCQGLG